MAVPKRKTIDINPPVDGPDREGELINMTHDNSVYLPQAIRLEDMDFGMFDFVKESNLKIQTDEGELIPAFYLTHERWADFSTTWKFTNETDKNIVMPFITLRRSEPPKYGTNANIKYRVAQFKKFTYVKVPTFDNGIHGVDIYKVPQPIPLDLTYEIRIFTHYQQDLNKFNELVQREFSSRQAYVIIKGYYLPVMLEDVSDESTLSDFEGQRFYSQTFNILMQGFLQSTDDMEIKKGIRRAVMNITEIGNSKNFL